MGYPPCSNGIEVRTATTVTWLDEAVFASHADCIVLAALNSDSPSRRRAFQFEIEPYRELLRTVILAPYDFRNAPADV